MGQQDWYLGIESNFMKYRDETLQLPLCLSAHIMERRVQISETYQKSEEITSFYPPYFRPFADFYSER